MHNEHTLYLEIEDLKEQLEQLKKEVELIKSGGLKGDGFIVKVKGVTVETTHDKREHLDPRESC